jgi:protein O-GlcNAc transferase
MTNLSQEQKIKLTNLYKNKEFSELEFQIESISNFKNRSAFLANLLGVVKLKKPSIVEQDFEAARKLFKDSYEKDPNYIDAMCNLGHVSLKLRNYEYIFKDLKRFIKNKDYNAKVYETLARIFFFVGQIDDALDLYKKMIDRGDLSKDASANFLASSNYSSNFSQIEYLNYCKKINDKFKPNNFENLIDFEFEKNPNNLNIGFISPDFVEHSVSEFLFGTIKELKKKNFKIHAFNLKKTSQLDKTSAALRETFDEWHDLAETSDLDSANIIRKNKVNILINLVGYFANNRFTIMKLKPAPIQMVWMGYTNTMGVDEIDYIVADPNLIKDDEKKLYSETVINLPKIWNCHSGIESKIEVEDSPCLKNEYITFGCFNNSSKISDAVIQTWGKLLLKLNNSKLIIKAPSEDAEIAQKNILKKFLDFNIDGSRILFSPREKKKENHYKMYNKIDLSLDTFPYTGVTTSIESVWMGVPVLTLKGNNFVSRCGESLNINLGMQEFIAEDENDYLNKAITISENREKLSTIRKSLRNKVLNSPLFDMESFGQDFANLLNDVWKKHPLK